MAGIMHSPLKTLNTFIVQHKLSILFMLVVSDVLVSMYVWSDISARAVILFTWESSILSQWTAASLTLDFTSAK